ncbi:MAG: right-handed parallel beta-helix repeat-containing protein [Candidatus Thermoplasmatota archaeon]|nr:right-handed parallel beta-helix repeat-containing protein [Candidatus Thermoplasmatota archaeon]MBU4591357.1 right-handed parallel beta-helix repeat-containing protein [Candidatus Thermoplasmatota archaeon]
MRKKIFTIWVCAVMVVSAFVMVGEVGNDVEGKELADEGLAYVPPQVPIKIDSNADLPLMESWSGELPYTETFNDELIIALQSDMKDMNPWNPDTNDVWKSNQLQYNFEGLMAYNPDYELYPALAAANPTGPNGADAWVSADGLQFSINLRSNVTFHDGHVMDSQDVVFSFQTLAWGLFQNQVLNSLYWGDGTTFTRYDGGISKIGVEANGTYRVDFHLNQPYSMFWYQTMKLPIIPFHIWNNHTVPAQGWYNTTDEFQVDYSYGSSPTETDATIGTGPFYLESWSPGNGSVIKAYENYWDKNGTTSWKGVEYPNYPKYVKEMRFKIYTQLDVAILALQNGEVHHLPWSLTPGNQNSLSLNPCVGIETNKDQGLFYMSFNFRKAGISDKNFRRAIAYCVDKQYIVDRLMGGYGIKGTVPMSVTNTFYVNTTVPAWIQGGNLDAAKALLDANGYTDKDGDGWRDMPDGSPIKFNILTPPKDYDPIRADSGIMIEKNLKSIGLNIASVPTSFDTLVSAAYVSVDFDMYILGWSVGSFPESYLRDFFHSDMDVALNPWGSNAAGYHNATVDAMIEDMEVEMDNDIRAGLIKDICGATMMDVVYDTLYYRTNIEAYRGDIWQGWVSGFGSIYNRFSINNLLPPSYMNPSYGNLEVGLYVPDTLPADGNSTCYVLVTNNDVPMDNAYVEVQTSFGTYISGNTDSEGNFNFDLLVPFIEGHVYIWANVTKDAEVGGAFQVSSVITSKPIAQLSLSTLDGVISPSGSTVVMAKVTDRDGVGMGGVSVNVDTNLMFGSVDAPVKVTDLTGFANFTYTAPPTSMLPNTNRYEQFKATISVPNAIIPEVQAASLIIGVFNSVKDWYSIDITGVTDYVITGNASGTLPMTTDVTVTVLDQDGAPVDAAELTIEVDNTIATPDALTKNTNVAGQAVFTLTAVDLGNSTESTMVRVYNYTKAYATEDTFLLCNANESSTMTGYAADIDFDDMVDHQGTATITATVWNQTGALAVGVPCQFFIPPTAEGIPGLFQGGDSWGWYEYGMDWDFGWWAGYLGSWFGDNATVTDGAGQLVGTITTPSFIADSVIPVEFGIGGYGITDAFNFTANQWWMEDYGADNWVAPFTDGEDGNYYLRPADFTLKDSGILFRGPIATMTNVNLDTPYFSSEDSNGTITITFQNESGALANSNVKISEGIANPPLLDEGLTNSSGMRSYLYDSGARVFDTGIGFTTMVTDVNYSHFPFNFYLPYVNTPDNLILTAEPSVKLIDADEAVQFNVTVTDYLGTPIVGAVVWVGNVSNTTDAMGETTFSLLMSGSGIQNTTFATSYSGWNGSMTAGVIVWAFTSLPWFDDMESGQGNWTVVTNNTAWELGNPLGYGPGTAYSGNNCWGTNVNTNYQDGAYAILTTPCFNSPSYDILSFYMWFRTEGWCDAGWVEVTSNGLNWTRIEPVTGPTYHDTTWGRGYSGDYTGNSTGWQYAEFDLSSFPGGTLSIRFVFRSDGSVTYPGWYIDDVYVGTPPDYRVRLTPETQTGSGTIGQTFDYSLTVENTGLQNDTYNLSIFGNSWDTRIYNANGTVEISNIYVASGMSENILVRVLVTFNATGGDQDISIITATSWNDFNARDNSTITTRVGAVHNIEQDIWYSTIQEAVDDANSGDHLWARNGTYHETVNIYKSITLTGENRNTTIIDGGGNWYVVYIQTSGVSISGFTIRNGGNYGVYLDSSYGCTIADNIISNNDCGIRLSKSNDNIITDNIFNSNSGFGIWLESSSRNTIANNTISNNYIGISLYSSSQNNTISNNLINNNYFGIRFEVERCNSNTITHCNILNNDGYGIYANSWGSFHILNLITYNNILSNGYCGIYIEWNTQYNYIHHNNIAANGWRNAYESSFNITNVWDDGYPSGGNYWGDYSGNDFYSGPLQNIPGFDGIGDTPYNVNGGGNSSSIQDQYPFIKPTVAGPQPITDSTPPQHSDEYPLPGSRISDATPEISVSISDDSWVNESTIKLYVNGFSVKTNKALRSDGTNVYFDVSYYHASGFIDGQVVTCRIVAMDIFSNSMEYIWQFTVDLTAPFVVSVYPLDSAIDVPRNTTISVTFSEPMDHASVEAAFTINPSVSGNFTWVGNTMTFHPNTDLAPTTIYNVSVNMNAMDLAGNHLADYFWSFTTEQGYLRIYHTPASTVELGTSLVVNCDVEAFWGSYIVNCTLYYIPVGGTEYIAISMWLQSGDEYYGTWMCLIPAQNSVGILRYYIEAQNDWLETATYPETDPVVSPVIVNVIDTAAPMHSDEQPADGTNASDGSVLVSVNITDISAINTGTIQLIINGFSVDYTLTLIPNGYRVSYFQEASFGSETVQCRIIADDVWGNQLDWTWSFTVSNPVMEISKEAPATANPGQMITYWVNFTNSGTAWAYNVTVTEIYPAGVTFVSSLPFPSFGNNVWFIGNVAPGASMSIQITVQVNIGANGTLINTVILDYENSVGTPFQEQDSAFTSVIAPLMMIDKTGPATASPGETITYTITYMNLGTDWAYNVWINETYPAGVTFINASPAPTIGNNAWFIGNVPPGGSGSIFINVTVIASSGNLTNSVFLEYTDSMGTPYPIVSDTTETIVTDSSPQHSNESPPIDGYTSDMTPVISVHVTDGSGVNASTIRLYINGFSIAYNLVPISDGYNVSYWHEGGFTDGEVVTCRIYAKDFSGNTLDFTWTFTVSSVPSFDIEIHAGWNLISLPLVQTNTSILSVLSSIDGQWDVVKYYDAITKTWKTYRVGATTNTLFDLDHTMGFWLHTTENTTLTVYGTPPTNTDILLKAGWNLVGYPSMNGTRTIAEALFGTGYLRVEGYDSASPYIKVLNDTYIMKAGEGYWVYVPSDTLWIVSFYSSPSEDEINAEGGFSETKGAGGAFTSTIEEYYIPLPSDCTVAASLNGNGVSSTQASSGGSSLFGLLLLLAVVCLAVRKHRN